MKMNQSGTTRGLKGESGEHTPKGATSRDSSGEKRVGASKVDKTPEPGQTGERIPAATASDRTGEKTAGITGGVGMGQHDALTGRDGSHSGKHDGRTGEFNSGRADGVAYKHTKDGY